MLINDLQWEAGSPPKEKKIHTTRAHKVSNLHDMNKRSDKKILIEEAL